MLGPTASGGLYGRPEALEEMDPFMGGGEMINEVHPDHSTYKPPPYRFEAGTPNIADVIAFQKAMEFINETGKENIQKHEAGLLAYASEKMGDINGFIPVGTAAEKVSVLSFLINNMHPFDVGMMLDAAGIAVRTGHHCAQPLMKRYGIEGTVRASFAVYNTKEEIDRLYDSLKRIAKRRN
jgi:cysteine desulfurase/selenocysteine lyase